MDMFIAGALVLIGLMAGYFLGRSIARAAHAAKWANLEKDSESAQQRIEQIRDQMAGERQHFERQLKEASALQEKLRAEKDAATLSLARLESNYDNLSAKYREQMEQARELQEKLTRDFENLANRIMEEKSAKFTQQNRENLNNILAPLQEKIQLFEKRIDDTHKESISYHSALREHIAGIRLMNEQMSRETVNLTRALKGDSKMQGNWGELVLERVLEKSGLERGREYEFQPVFSSEDGGRVFPDVVVNLPDGKKMVIDSKVSLTAYERCCNEEDEAARSLHLRDHVSSIKRHVEQLGAKNYHDLYRIESPDFVLLFIPIEPAFALALREDPTLYNKAFERNIVIVTPATLLATLRTIDSMWTNQKQQENAWEIARQAGALYDKFEGLVQDLMTVGRKLDEGKKAYDESMKKLHTGNGNLVISVEKLKRMGAKAKKSLPDPMLRQAQASDVQDCQIPNKIGPTVIN